MGYLVWAVVVLVWGFVFYDLWKYPFSDPYKMPKNPLDLNGDEPNG